MRSAHRHSSSFLTAHAPLHGSQLAVGRATAARVLIKSVAAGSLGAENSEKTTKKMIPGVLDACTITWARPLKRLRLDPLSDSWQFGSPLPTPRSLPSPVTKKLKNTTTEEKSRPASSASSTRTTQI